MVPRARLAAAANIQHDRAELGGAGGASPARRGWNRHRPAAIIDPLLKDGRLVPFRHKAIGKAAYYLVRPPASRSAAARTGADGLMAEGCATVQSGLREAAGGADLSGRRKKTKKARGQKA